jgi:molecular chaperone DnaK
MADHSQIFGIHLGGSNSSIAYVDEHGQAQVILNAEGSRITPSAVFFDGSNRIVGSEAKNCALIYPDRVVQFVQRQMGQPDWVFRMRNRV